MTLDKAMTFRYSGLVSWEVARNLPQQGSDATGSVALAVIGKLSVRFASQRIAVGGLPALATGGVKG